MRLEDACELIADCPHTTAPDEGQGYPLVRTPNIGLGRLVFDNMHRVSESVYKQRNKRATPRAGDLIYAREAMPGNVALLLPGQEVCLGQRTVLIRPNNEIVESAYLTYLLLSNECRNKLVGTANGATVLHVNIPAIRNFDITLPPLPTQRKIAKVLSAYDDLIENNTKRIRILERMAEELYKEWFVRFRFPGHETAKFVNGLPEGWRVERIEECCDSIGGGTPSTSEPAYWGGEIKWVTPTDVTAKKSIPLLNVAGRITEEGLRRSSAKLLPPYSILMTSRASIGYFGISPETVCTNQGFIAIIPTRDSLRMYMLWMLKSRREEIINNANGSTFLEISKGRFRKMKMVLPCEGLLERFEDEAVKSFQMVLNLERQNALLARQRDLLLPRLMSGKLSVEGVG